MHLKIVLHRDSRELLGDSSDPYLKRADIINRSFKNRCSPSMTVKRRLACLRLLNLNISLHLILSHKVKGDDLLSLESTF